MKLQTFRVGAVVSAAALTLMTLTAAAQQPPAVAPAPAAKPVTPPPAAKPPAPAPAAAKPAAVKKTASVCKGLDETACKANPDCGYVVPKDANKATGTVQKPYCRKVAGVAKTAADKKAAATPAPKPAVAAPAAAPVAPKPAATPTPKPAPKAPVQ